MEKTVFCTVKMEEAYCRQYFGGTYVDDCRESYRGKGCDGEGGSEFDK